MVANSKSDGLYPDVAYADFHASVGTQTTNSAQNVPGWSVSNSSNSPWTVDRSCGRDNSKCLHAHQTTPGNVSQSIYPFTLIPGHKYTLRWQARQSAGTSGNLNVQTYANYSRDRAWPPTLQLIPTNYDNRNMLTSNQPTVSPDGSLSGGDATNTAPPANGDWEQRGLQFIVPRCQQQSNCPNIWQNFDGNIPLLPDMPYLSLNVNVNSLSGDMYFDDFTLYDETAQESAQILNGDFESDTLSSDTAMITYNWGYTMGKPNQNPTQRVINAPIVNTNVLIWNNNDDDKNPSYSQDIIDTKDQSYSWYKKSYGDKSILMVSLVSSTILHGLKIKHP